MACESPKLPWFLTGPMAPSVLQSQLSGAYFNFPERSNSSASMLILWRFESRCNSNQNREYFANYLDTTKLRLKYPEISRESVNRWIDC